MLMGLCATFEGALGVALIAGPYFAASEVFGAFLPGDIAVARGAGVFLLFLALVGSPIGEDIDPLILLVQFIYNLLTSLYLGYLSFTSGFVNNLLWPVCVLHAVIATLLAGLIHEKSVAINSGRANQH
jgi:hypothetical protein